MDKNILRILGKNIKIERIRNDLSQEQLAEKQVFPPARLVLLKMDSSTLNYF